MGKARRVLHEEVTRSAIQSPQAAQADEDGQPQGEPQDESTLAETQLASRLERYHSALEQLELAVTGSNDLVGHTDEEAALAGVVEKTKNLATEHARLVRESGELGTAVEDSEHSALVSRHDLMQRTLGTLTEIVFDNPSEAFNNASDEAEAAEKLVGAVRALKDDHYGRLADRLEAPNRPHIVCLCGSMKYSDKMDAEAVKRTIAGQVVLMPNVDLRKKQTLFMTEGTCPSCHGKSGLQTICTLCDHTGKVKTIDEKVMASVKAALDDLHLNKIDMADEARFVNVAGYFGESTTRELKHAVAANKTLTFTDIGGVNPAWVKDLLRDSGYEVISTPLNGEEWRHPSKEWVPPSLR